MKPKRVGEHLQGKPWGSTSSRESSRTARLRRRCLTIPAVTLSFILLLLLLLPLLLLSVLFDAALCRKGATVRVVLYGTWWTGLETFGLLTAGILWLRFAHTGRLDSPESLHAHSRLQRWWASNLVSGARILLKLEYSFDGGAELLRSGPTVVLARHGSQGDALLLTEILTKAGIRPRFVLKKQLLWDPCLDVVGHRIPNYFVDRNSEDNQEELDNIGKLASSMDPDEALVIFPEGTRFSLSKQTHAVAFIERTVPERAERARRLRHVLPIRTSGLLEILIHASTADLVLLNHVGINDFRNLTDLWRSIPIERPLTFHAHRIQRSLVPDIGNTKALIEWLDSNWCTVDQWVEDHMLRPKPALTETRQ